MIDNLNLSNRIITVDDIIDVVEKMYNTIEQYKQKSAEEMKPNEGLKSSEQRWQFKDLGSNVKCYITYVNGNSVTYSNFDDFRAILKDRNEEVKSFHASLYLGYSTKPTEAFDKVTHQGITFYVYEDNVSLHYDTNEGEQYLRETYDYIMNKMNSSVERYDNTIKKKGMISFVVGLAIAFIPAIILGTSLLLVESIKEIYISGYIVYPLLTILFACLLGALLGPYMLEGYYKNIVPNKKYVGYSNGKSVYKDDVENFTNKNEVLIGKNAHNIEKREIIKETYNKYKKMIPVELIITLVISIVIIIMGFME